MWDETSDCLKREGDICVIKPYYLSKIQPSDVPRFIMISLFGYPE